MFEKLTEKFDIQKIDNENIYIGTLFKNIIGKVNKSKVFNFPLDEELTKESARYFLVKKYFNEVKKENGENEIVYDGYVYSTGVHKDWNKFITTPRCFDIFSQWRFSNNKSSFLNCEVIEIDMNN